MACGDATVAVDDESDDASSTSTAISDTDHGEVDDGIDASSSTSQGDPSSSSDDGTDTGQAGLAACDPAQADFEPTATMSLSECSVGTACEVVGSCVPGTTTAPGDDDDRWRYTWVCDGTRTSPDAPKRSDELVGVTMTIRSRYPLTLGDTALELQAAADYAHRFDDRHNFETYTLSREDVPLLRYLETGANAELEGLSLVTDDTQSCDPGEAHEYAHPCIHPRGLVGEDGETAAFVETWAGEGDAFLLSSNGWEYCGDDAVYERRYARMSAVHESVVQLR